MVEAEKKTPDDMAADVVADIKRAESDILDLYERHCRGPVGYQHFYLLVSLVVRWPKLPLSAA
ncbi:hypothetical protein [Bradyrhizobium sp. CCBAU 53340]|uniref:hypothetical protein n=1 Tax=Bradyrhizobium sp. CCBAU 53340 TaxID=1325112 RepID=UPI00188CCE71|nr:hypothetical protein [Bradyrhizobium sp. CCBAU 53340]